MTEALTLLRGILLMLSFAGLCAAARRILKLDRFAAPFFTACGIIAVLMLGGMLRILPVALAALYAGGFAGAVWVWLIRREKPDFALIGLLAAFTAFLVWRFYGTPVYRTDDFSHWGLAARHLVETDAFPDSRLEILTFQSYPLGAASFIYYVSRAVCREEWLWLVAINLLTGMMYLPVLAHIRSHRGVLVPLALIMGLYLFQFNRNPVTLQVDSLLPFMGIGAAAAVTACGKNERKQMLLTAAVFCISIVWIKSSGPFFAFTTVAALWVRMRRNGESARSALKAALLCAACAAGAYLLWNLHIRISYPDALNSKHAVSVSAYAQEAASKDNQLILMIAAAMLRRWLHPASCQLVAVLLWLATGAAMLVGCLVIPGQKPRLKSVLMHHAAIAVVYALWYGMLFAMYVLSMPPEEASRLASVERYDGTGLTFLIGLSLLLLFHFFGRSGLSFTRLIRAGLTAAYACILVFVAYCLISGAGFVHRFLTRSTAHLPIRQALIDAREQTGVPDGGRYLLFMDDCVHNLDFVSSYYCIKYEYRSDDVVMIVSNETGNPDGPRYMCITHDGAESTDDAEALLGTYMDDCDALIVVDHDEAFEAALGSFLETYGGDTPVCSVFR